MSKQIEPVSSEDLARLGQLQMARRGIADRVLELREEDIHLMAAAKRVTGEWQSLLARIAEERGLDSNTPFDIHPKTGEIQVGASAPNLEDSSEPPQEDSQEEVAAAV